MFANTKAFSGFAVDDVEAARAFYGETLGLKTSEQNGLMMLHLAGDRDTVVYPKPDYTPATYTILNFPVDDIDQAVDELAARGVGFERYDGMPQDEKGLEKGRVKRRMSPHLRPRARKTDDTATHRPRRGLQLRVPRRAHQAHDPPRLAQGRD